MRTEDSNGAAILTVAVATITTRAPSIDFTRLPPDPRWRYAIFCQGDAAAISASRADVSVIGLQSTGAGASRNAAIAACSTELLLFSDDDVVLSAEGLVALISTFAADPAVSLVAGKTLRESGEPERAYPVGPGRLTLFNSARVGTVELAVRAARIRAAGVGFDERFGAGTGNFLGDEYIFIADCLRAGLRGVYVPIAIAVHRGPSSGLDFSSEAAARARAKVFERVFGQLLAVPVKLAFLWRHRRRFSSWREVWRFAHAFLPPH